MAAQVPLAAAQSDGPNAFHNATTPAAAAPLSTAPMTERMQAKQPGHVWFVDDLLDCPQEVYCLDVLG